MPLRPMRGGRRHPPPARRHLVLARALRWSTALALAAAGTALAQVRVRVEIPYGASVGLASSGGATAGQASLVTGLHVDAEAALEPFHLTVRLDPSMTVLDAATMTPAVPPTAPWPSWEPGLTEAYALLREGRLDVSAGIERLPLETARLTVPFQLDRNAADGQRRGLLGARASLYLDPMRLRGALFERGGSLGGALSVRADLTSAQLEAHAVILDGLAFGASASGTLADTVLYGEAWLLTEPWRARAALGANGYLGDALWTAEVAFAPPTGLPDAAAVPQLAAQVTVPWPAEGSLDVYAGAALMDSVLAPGERRVAGQASLTWVTGNPDVQLELGPAVRFGELGAHYVLTLRLTTYTAF